METSIQTFIETNSGLKNISLFGYSSKGLPGLEINGLKSNGKLIKEKMIYLTRKKKLKVPLLRYCLCVDTQASVGELAKNQLNSLEIPFLLMFWHLAGILPIRKLDDCRVAGYFDIKGRFYFIKTQSLKPYINIGIGEQVEVSGLLEGISDLVFKLD